jgi:hypothetical protein
MADLSGHGAKPAHLPKQPFDHLVAASEIVRQKPADLVGKIEQQGARFEEDNGFAAIPRGVIDHRGDLVVGRDGQEFRLVLVALAQIDRYNTVWKAGLGHEYRHFQAVGRTAIIEVNHLAIHRLGNPGWKDRRLLQRTNIGKLHWTILVAVLGLVCLICA